MKNKKINIHDSQITETVVIEGVERKKKNIKQKNIIEETSIISKKIENLQPNDYLSAYSEDNPFPIYSKGNDENLYLHIYNFISNGLKNGQRVWPAYIENIKDKNIRHKKKLQFYRKLYLKNKVSCKNDNNTKIIKEENSIIVIHINYLNINIYITIN